jgi:hypothetical protein
VIGDPGHDRAEEHGQTQPPADLRSGRQDSAACPRASRWALRRVSSTWNQRRRRDRVRVPSSRPTRVASSRFARHQSATHASIPRK